MGGKNTKACIDMFNTLYGAYLAGKKIHFTTTSQAEHLRTDNAVGEILDYADRIMENCMGLFGRVTEDQFKFVDFGTFATDKLYYQALRQKLADFRKIIESNTSTNGIINIVDEFAQEINKWIYLSDNK